MGDRWGYALQFQGRRAIFYGFGGFWDDCPCRRATAPANSGKPGQPEMRPRRLPPRKKTKAGTPCKPKRRPRAASSYTLHWYQESRKSRSCS